MSFFFLVILGGATLEVSRRTLLKTTAVGAGLSLAGFGFNIPSVHAAVKGFKLEDGKEYTSILCQRWQDD